MKRYQLFIASFLATFLLYSFQYVSPAQAWIQHGVDCDPNSEMTARELWNLNNGILSEPQRLNVEANSCEIGKEKCLQDQGQIVVPRFFCQPDPDIGVNEKILNCTCINPGHTGEEQPPGQNGYTCTLDGKPCTNDTCGTGPGQPFVDYCKINEACQRGESRPIPMQSDTKYRGGVVIRGVTCTQLTATATCTCKTPGGNQIDCTDDKTKQVQSTTCAKPEQTCTQSTDPKSVKVDREQIKDGRTFMPTATLYGVTCELPKAVCSCDNPGQLGKGTLKCTMNGKEFRPACKPDMACVPETDGSKTLDKGLLDNLPSEYFNTIISGVMCKQAGLPGVTNVPPVPPVPPPPCAPGKMGADGVCAAFLTDFGEIDTNVQGFVLRLFAILLSISGGIALLLIIKAGYLLMVSAGNPEKIKNGREQLVAAIVGLLFIIFSFVILGVIGDDLLKIPGFVAG